MFCKNCGSQVPEGIAFCAACGTPVAGAAPAAASAAAPAAPKGDKSALIKLIAVIAAVAVVLGLLISLLGGGSAKSVAKKYVKAQIEGDLKAQLSLSIGNMEKMLKKEGNDKILDVTFETMEKRGEAVDVDVNITKLNQFYKAGKKITKAEHKENYGKNFKVKIEVRKVKDLRNSDIEAIQDMYDNDMFEDYVNVDKIKKGKLVTVKVIIDGSEDTYTDDFEIPVVKYKGKWVVADSEICGAIAAMCLDLKDIAEESGMDEDDLEEFLNQMEF